MDRKDFISNVESTQGALRRFLAALCCGDTTLADDLAQETYMKAFLSINTLADSDKFKAWIYRIAYNNFVNHCRTRRMTEVIGETVAMVSAAEEADSSFRYQELHSALSRLSDTERTAILLYYFEGYTVREITEVVGSSADAVRQHLSRGRNRLRSLLSKNN